MTILEIVRPLKFQGYCDALARTAGVTAADIDLDAPARAFLHRAAEARIEAGSGTLLDREAMTAWNEWVRSCEVVHP